MNKLLNKLFNKCIYLSFLIILIYFLYFNYFTSNRNNRNNRNNRENFISKIKLDKNLIVVMMNGTIGKEYKGTIKNLCNNFIDNCTYNFNKEKADNSNKVSITYDKSMKTSTKMKNVNYLVIYEEKDPNNSYNKKFIKKWCSKKKKEKDNYIVIDYNNIYKDSSKLLNEVEKKFKINIPMKGLLNYGSINNVNLDEIKNIASSVSMNNLTKQFMNKI
jgi:hypothetical protein